MSSRREISIRIAPLQTKTLIETKNRTLKCLKWHYSTVWSIKNVVVLTEDVAFALLFRPLPREFAIQAKKKCQCPGVSLKTKIKARIRARKRRRLRQFFAFPPFSRPASPMTWVRVRLGWRLELALGLGGYDLGKGSFLLLLFYNCLFFLLSLFLFIYFSAYRKIRKVLTGVLARLTTLMLAYHIEVPENY